MDDDTKRRAQDPPGDTMSRRLFFGRAVGLAGAATVLFGLTGCPGGEQDDDDDGGDEDDDD